jgi:hypothetical protein
VVEGLNGRVKIQGSSIEEVLKAAEEIKSKVRVKIPDGAYSNFGAPVAAPAGGGKIYKTKRIMKNKYRNTKRLRSNR